MSKEEDERFAAEFKKMVDLITEEAAEDILPQLKLINGQLRGFIDIKARGMNFETLSMFVTEIYQRGLTDGYKLGRSDRE